jgi:hypothetical protein
MTAVDMATETQLQWHRDRQARRARFAAAALQPKPKRPTLTIVAPALPCEAKAPAPDIDEEFAWGVEMIGLVPIVIPPVNIRRIEDIQRAVVRYFDIPRDDLSSERRNAQVVKPRQIAMFFCRHLTPRSFDYIGKRFGGRDHSTVLHAVRTVTAKCRRDIEYAYDVAMIESELVQ